MKPRILNWKNPKGELTKRLSNARRARRVVERQWAENERILYGRNSYGLTASPLPVHGLEESGYSGEQVDATNPGSNINYTFKNARFIHAQLSANPPTVLPQPTSSDVADRRRADAADRLIRYSIRQYSLHERIDLATLNCVTYGTGILKHYWDPSLGDLVGVNPQTGEYETEGDLRVRSINPWRFLIDADAEVWDEVNYVFEEIHLPYEEALFLFPDKEDVLKKVRVEGEVPYQTQDEGNRSVLDPELYDSVVLYEYWERGMPSNGMLGRYALITEQGDFVDELRPNPHRFAMFTDLPEGWPEGRPVPEVACLPYSIMTDIDVPMSVWGKSFVEYASPLQDFMNEMDDITIENARAHGMVRAVIPADSEVDGMTDSAWDIIKIKGINAPHFMRPPPPMPELHTTRDRMRLGIDDMAGVNESMFGQQSRETSGFSMQYATNQGNLIRRRLFNKYVLMTESLFKNILKVFIKHWEDPRTIKVLGREQAFEVIDLKGADIDGGYDIQVQYGNTLSLDPVTRRQEILTLLPFFEKTGADMSRLLELMKLSDLGAMYDDNKLAATRQQEIFERIVATGQQVQPLKYQDHAAMLKYAFHYVMTAEFDSLPEEAKALIYEHIELREAEVSARAAEAAGAGAAPAGLGPEALPPAMEGQVPMAPPTSPEIMPG